MINSFDADGFPHKIEVAAAELEALLQAEDADDAQLLKVTDIFESLINSLLNANIDSDSKRSLLKIALENNAELVRLAEEKRAETKLALSNFVRGQKAVKNYK